MCPRSCRTVRTPVSDGLTTPLGSGRAVPDRRPKGATTKAASRLRLAPAPEGRPRPFKTELVSPAESLRLDGNPSTPIDQPRSKKILRFHA